MMEVEVKHTQKDDEGRFFVEQSGKELGYLDYTLDDRSMTIEHTVVEDELKGTGAARMLVDEAYRFATERQYSIASNCEYGAHVLKKYYAIT